jgi:hypothetical protein
MVNCDQRIVIQSEKYPWEPVPQKNPVPELERRRLKHPGNMQKWGRHYSKKYRIIRALAEVVAWMEAEGGANLMSL